jgi:hypothetical protein
MLFKELNYEEIGVNFIAVITPGGQIMSLANHVRLTLLFAFLGAQVTASMAAQPGGGGSGGTTKTVSPLVWVDAAGKQVGRDRGDPGLVFATIQGINVGFRLASTDVPGQAKWQRSTWYYASLDCSGSPIGASDGYFGIGTSKYTAIYFDEASGHHLLYYVGPMSLMAYPSIASVNQYDWASSQWDCFQIRPDSSIEVLIAPTQDGPIVDLDALYQLPLKLQ